jgi:hypothetical protein
MFETMRSLERLTPHVTVGGATLLVHTANGALGSSAAGVPNTLARWLQHAAQATTRPRGEPS